MQKLVDELREFIQSALLDDDYKRRLLLKLEGLQKEIHKRVSDIDRLWALIGEAGVVAGKLGQDSKPFVDRILELSRIGWRAQANAEKLPASAEPVLLENPGKTLES